MFAFYNILTIKFHFHFMYHQISILGIITETTPFTASALARVFRICLQCNLMQLNPQLSLFLKCQTIPTSVHVIVMSTKYAAKQCVQFYKMMSLLSQVARARVFTCIALHLLNCKINGTVHIFFLKKSYLSPRCPKLPNFFFSSAYFPLNLNVIIDLGHIWGSIMAKFDKMSKKSAFLVVPDFGYPPVVGAFVSKCWT